MAVDAIMAEVRRVREALASPFDFDLKALIEDARKRQAAGGRKVVSFPPTPLSEPSVKPMPHPAEEKAIG